MRLRRQSLTKEEAIRAQKEREVEKDTMAAVIRRERLPHGAREETVRPYLGR